MEVRSTFDDREIAALRECMAQKDMSESAILRHAFRTFHLVDQYLVKGFKLLFQDPNGNIIDPFDHGPKMAPMPEPQIPSGF